MEKKTLGRGDLSCLSGSPLTSSVTLGKSFSSMGFSFLTCQIWGLDWMTSKFSLAPDPLEFYSTCHFYDVSFALYEIKGREEMRTWAHGG